MISLPCAASAAMSSASELSQVALSAPVARSTSSAEPIFTTMRREVEKGVGMGKLHPVAWYHDFDGGRSFYTALGHMPACFSDASFLNFLYAGIFWAATGKK